MTIDWAGITVSAAFLIVPAGVGWIMSVEHRIGKIDGIRETLDDTKAMVKTLLEHQLNGSNERIAPRVSEEDFSRSR